jgi:bifunctional UDP-N-acetylglucosamine pyrophosphorylase/glucosamine-1-phosphate N-acetyltransferase
VVERYEVKAGNQAGGARALPGVILAAGKGTRLDLGAPKVTVPIGGRPMILRVIEAVRGAGVDRVILVVGHRANDVQATVGDHVEYVVQEEQLGTGHAAQQAERALAGYRGPVIVTYGDIPLLQGRDIAELVARHRETGAAATLLTAVFVKPGNLGRIVRNPDGTVQGIVEAKDATPEQIKITEINVGVFCFEAPRLFEVLRQVKNDNAQHQYYLTDVIGLLVEQGERVEAVMMEFASAGVGVNTPEDLAHAQRLVAAGEA